MIFLELVDPLYPILRVMGIKNPVLNEGEVGGSKKWKRVYCDWEGSEISGSGSNNILFDIILTLFRRGQIDMVG